ncbi:hypothetical protein BOX15_Mlig008118g1, partial [Macrostomum lignano]
ESFGLKFGDMQHTGSSQQNVEPIGGSRAGVATSTTTSTNQFRQAKLLRSNMLFIVGPGRSNQHCKKAVWNSCYGANREAEAHYEATAGQSVTDEFLRHRLAPLAHLIDTHSVFPHRNQQTVLGHMFLLSEGLTESGRCAATMRLLCAVNQIGIDDTAAQTKLAHSALAVYMYLNEDPPDSNNNTSSNQLDSRLESDNVKRMGWFMIHGLPSTSNLVEEIAALLGRPLQPVDIVRLDISVNDKSVVFVRDVYQPAGVEMKRRLVELRLFGVELFVKPQPLSLQTTDEAEAEAESSESTTSDTGTTSDSSNTTDSQVAVPSAVGQLENSPPDNSAEAADDDVEVLHIEPAPPALRPVPVRSRSRSRSPLSRPRQRSVRPMSLLPTPPPTTRYQQQQQQYDYSPARIATRPSVFSRLGPPPSEGDSNYPIVIDDSHDNNYHRRRHWRASIW